MSGMTPAALNAISKFEPFCAKSRWIVSLGLIFAAAAESL